MIEVLVIETELHPFNGNRTAKELDDILHDGASRSLQQQPAGAQLGLTAWQTKDRCLLFNSFGGNHQGNETETYVQNNELQKVSGLCQGGSLVWLGRLGLVCWLASVWGARCFALRHLQ
jgi:hypothetical protein